jgi:hypothetical protein
MTITMAPIASGASTPGPVAMPCAADRQHQKKRSNQFLRVPS